MKKAIFSLLITLSLLMIAPQAMAETKAAPAKTESSPPQEYWTKRCQDLKSADGKKTTHYCEIFQQLSMKEKDGKLQRVLEFGIGYPPGEKKARGVLILPLGVMLEQPMSLTIDGKDEVKFTIRYCTADGCFAFLILSEEFLEKLGKGEKLSLNGTAMNGQDLHIMMALTGFGKALAQVKP